MGWWLQYNIIWKHQKEEVLPPGSQSEGKKMNLDNPEFYIGGYLDGIFFSCKNWIWHFFYCNVHVQLFDTDVAIWTWSDSNVMLYCTTKDQENNNACKFSTELLQETISRSAHLIYEDWGKASAQRASTCLGCRWSSAWWCAMRSWNRVVVLQSTLWHWTSL